MDLTHKLEDTIEQRGLVAEYLAALSEIVTSEAPLDDATWRLLRATPSQRLRAFHAAVIAHPPTLYLTVTIDGQRVRLPVRP